MNEYACMNEWKTNSSSGALDKILTKKGKNFYKAENFTIAEECNMKKHSKTPRKSKWCFSQNSTF